MSKTVACPVCGATVPWTPSSTWRPFCSERCKTIDLGDWASERHVIAGRPDVNDDSATRDDGTARDH